MEQVDITVINRLLFSILAGVAIGLERTHHGRPAGLRTHTLVCTASCLLMLFTVFQWKVLSDAPIDTIRVDPTRMAQGIMTGIGFLGAGVIMREKFTIRGLTTAGSIWMTASVGIIIGIGLYFAALVATIATLVILSFFRYIERKIPTYHFGKLMVMFKTSETMSQSDLFEILKEHKVIAFAPSFNLENDGRSFKYEMTVRSRDFSDFEDLSNHLREMETVREFSLIPTGD